MQSRYPTDETSRKCNRRTSLRFDHAVRFIVEEEEEEGRDPNNSEGVLVGVIGRHGDGGGGGECQ